MLLSQIVKELTLDQLTDFHGAERTVGGVYVADLISLVMANAKQDDLWLTHQGHQNIVALASLLRLSCVVIGGGMRCQEETIRKANEEKISLFGSTLPIYELAGRLYVCGLQPSAYAEMD
ncbi:MAG: hypothetical protein M1552_04745 [Firmicutes bacterium]|nr:hypothetical protein [Dethiobacter sp.]MBS3899388.1 hypothetical protein [Dethiobacter sp.]MCL4463841.1 hypothetical protein [Bacillota bacterium]MCL5993459.1 hypothetical protein [Bacillota bacterium]